VTDILIIVVAIVAIYFILKIAFKILKTALLLGVAALVVYYLVEYGFLKGLF
jgi:uncharacterized membrane protein YjjB (DUF3815 family)